jgi:hypothetical protein
MTSTYCWYEPYKTALLETDGMKIRERIQMAEAKIQDRQRVLAEDRGGTAEERQAISLYILSVPLWQHVRASGEYGCARVDPLRPICVRDAESCAVAQC